MKKQFMTTVVLLGLVIVASSGIAKAQIEGRLKADIPFSFYVSDKQLPAGEYIVTSKDVGAGLMEICSMDGRSNAVFLTIGTQEKNASAPSELIFQRYGGKTFLSQIVEQGERDAAQLLKTKMEKRLEQAGEEVGMISIALR